MHNREALCDKHRALLCKTFGAETLSTSEPLLTKSEEKHTIRVKGGDLVKRAFGYIRVSTSKQKENGHSLEAQQEKIQAYCTMKGFDVAGLFVDPGQSGSKPLAERPEGGAQLVARLRKGDHVIVTKLDRAFRNAVDCLTTVDEWERKGITLHLLDMGGISIDTKTPAGKMFLTMMAGFAEMERALASERTQAVSNHLKAAGKVYSAPPFGYDRAGDHLVENPREQAIIARIRSLRAEGLSFKRIADQLTADSVPTKQGGAWHQYTISKILSA